jgi:general stress protein 26
MLTTAEPDGTLHSRPMLTYCSGIDGVLWLFSHADAPKVQEAEDNHHVNVTYADSLVDHYVSISGTAEVERDRRRMEELWDPTLEGWFPGGPGEPNLALLRVHIQRAELWDARTNAVAQLICMARNLAGRGDHCTPIHEKIVFGADTTVSP